MKEQKMEHEKKINNEMPFSQKPINDKKETKILIDNLNDKELHKQILRKKLNKQYNEQLEDVYVKLSGGSKIKLLIRAFKQLILSYIGIFDVWSIDSPRKRRSKILFGVGQGNDILNIGNDFRMVAKDMSVASKKVKNEVMCGKKNRYN